MRFLLMVIDTTSPSASGDELAAIDAFNQQLTDNNQLLLAVGIADPGKSFMVDGRQAPASMAQESLFSGPDYHSGFWLISAESVDEAKELARQGSKACNRKVELRPLLG
jgi:hypothetical protein